MEEGPGREELLILGRPGSRESTRTREQDVPKGAPPGIYSFPPRPTCLQLPEPSVQVDPSTGQLAALATQPLRLCHS